MTFINSKGWKNRRLVAETNAYENADEKVKAIRRDRAKIYAEAEEVGRLSAEAHAAVQAASQIPCSCCAGTGTVSAPTAAAMLEAWYHYHFSDRKPSKGTVAALLAIARGEPTPPGTTPPPFSYGMTRPTPAESTATPRLDPEPVPVSETVETPKPVKPAKGLKAAEESFTHDGALIEI